MSKKKDISKKLTDAFELQNRLTFEYYLNCYEQIMARYPSLAEMNNKQNTNGTEAKYVELWEFLKDKNSRSDESSMEEPARVQAILERKRNLDDAMDDFVGKLDLKLWASYPYPSEPVKRINFETRISSFRRLDVTLGNTIGWFKLTGDDNYHWFEYPETELLEACFIAGIDMFPRGFLSAAGEADTYVHEVDEFCSLSFIDNFITDSGKDEIGFITVFSKNPGIMFDAHILGQPTLDTAETPSYSSFNFDYFQNMVRIGDVDPPTPRDKGQG